MEIKTKYFLKLAGTPGRIAMVVFAVAVFWGITLGVGAQQEQDVTQWTAETHDRTNFPLIGKHRTVSCRECHLSLVFEGTPSDCEACHWERRQDDRYQLRLGSRCGECHTPLSWKNVAPNKWNHEFVAGFPLGGVHRTLDCVDCHGDSGFESGKINCFDCHSEDYNGAKEPDHAAAGFPTQCHTCHTNNRWEGAVFTHSGFVLLGQHRTLNCSECHRDGQFVGLSTECWACHDQNYNEVKDPDHKQLGYPLDCEICHGTGSRSWEDAVFLHTTFRLKGNHRLAACSECHSSGQYQGLPSDCVNCHREDYDRAENPDHQKLGFPTACEICHGSGARTWEGAKFNHSSFVLKGQHKLADCSDCHSSGQFAGLPSECFACHKQDYDGAEEPDHVALGFPFECEACHGTSADSWEGAKLSHTAFPLSGQHKVAACSDCHINGQSVGLSSSCASCHLDDYNNTQDPDHQVLNYSTQCQLCHGTSADTWEGAKFSHTAFPLSGRHKLASCSDCHTGDVYAGLPSECFACHKQDYDGAKDPDHLALGFPTQCEACHGVQADTWDGAQFDHATIWPLRGAHTNLDCSLCHVDGSPPPQECFACHSQDYEETSDPDHQTAGFPTSCESCHFPSHVYWTQAVFDHQFPITSGKHVIADCTDCHTTSNYKEFYCLSCHAHNENNMSKKHKNVGGYVYNSLNCYACHPQGKD